MTYHMNRLFKCGTCPYTTKNENSAKKHIKNNLCNKYNKRSQDEGKYIVEVSNISDIKVILGRNNEVGKLIKFLKETEIFEDTYQ